MAWHSKEFKIASIGLRVQWKSVVHNALVVAVAIAFLFSQTVHANDQEDAPVRNAIIVVGAPGEDAYAEIFRKSAQQWVEVCRANAIEVILVDGSSGSTDPAQVPTDRDRMLEWIDTKLAAERWIIMIGHGTSDRDSAKFNLRGRDLAAADLAKSLANHASSRWLIVHCGSSSGPWINTLSGPERVVITATKSGAEQNYARFGEYLAQTISDPDSDLDHDDSVSILEAFLAASKRVAQFYSREDRIPSEQALLDDNNDQKGTPAVFYRGFRPVKSPADGLQPDGLLAARIQIATPKPQAALTAEQQSQIERIEEQLAILRTQKKAMDESEYLAAIEPLFLEIIQARQLQE